MASLITCPHCGVRPKEEFSIRGDAGPLRPQPEAKFAAWDAYVHLRDNVRGVMDEHWQHVGGCRRWLTSPAAASSTTCPGSSARTTP